MVAARKFLPFLHWWPRVDRATWHADAVAAITAAVIVLPQGIAFAGIAGLPPEYGFYTAMVVPIVAALFGSSWHLVSGPTTAISALVFATLVTRFQPASAAFIEAAITMTLLVGVFQVILGALRMGAVANFMSPSVMTGFTAGAALIIALSQLGSALGIELARPEQLGVYVSGLLEGMQRLNLHSAGITLTTVVVAISVKRLAPKWPNYLIGMLCGSLVAVGIDAARHGVLFVGSLPSIIPPGCSRRWQLPARCRKNQDRKSGPIRNLSARVYRMRWAVFSPPMWVRVRLRAPVSTTRQARGRRWQQSCLRSFYSRSCCLSRTCLLMCQSPQSPELLWWSLTS